MSISIVVPTFNSASFIKESLSCLKEVAESMLMDYEIIVIDDASTDGTAAIVMECSEHDLHIKLIRNSLNQGQQKSTLIAIMSATGQYIVTIDDDMKYHPEEIPLLLGTLQQGHYDLVYGVPNKIKRGFVNLIMYNTYLLLLKSGNEQRKTSFRLLKRELADKLPPFQNVVPFVLDYILCSLTHQVEHVSVRYTSRDGTSRYGVRMYLKVLRNAIEIKKKGLK